MAEKIYSAPAEIKAPEFKASEGFETYMAACDKHVQAVKDYCKKNGSSECAGEEIHFPVGDGAARYVVFSLRPVQLIHLAVGDRWQFQYAHLLTAKAIREEVRRNKNDYWMAFVVTRTPKAIREEVRRNKGLKAMFAGRGK